MAIFVVAFVPADVIIGPICYEIHERKHECTFKKYTRMSVCDYTLKTYIMHAYPILDSWLITDNTGTLSQLVLIARVAQMKSFLREYKQFL